MEPAPNPRLLLRYAARSDIGLVRQTNEDSGYAGGHMLVVADGMGGHAAGELASSTAVAIFAELDREPPGENVLAALADAIENAHDELRDVVAASPDFSGMGTTVTAMSWEGDRVAIAHVGDSRAYLLRDEKLTQLTKDHTFVQTLVDSGRITRAEAAVHRKRNLLIKALDGVHVVEPDLSMREAKAGDRFLLCTDGLHGVLSDEQLQELMTGGDPTGTVTSLVEKALEAGAPDNVTCVIADLVTDPSDPIINSNAASPTPVVVGAAAELRNRAQLPGIEFPLDYQPDPDHDPLAEPPPAADPPTSAEDPAVIKRRRRGRWLIAVIAVLVLMLAGLIGFWSWAHSPYYVGDVNGQIGIYQGIPGGPGPHGFSAAIQTSATQVAALPTYYQEQVTQNITTKSLDEARKVLATLETEAAKCQVKPIPLGCPQNPGAQGTPSTATKPTSTAR
ncbi:MAG: protein phosphatase 2C domain-containing protein [Actinomycetes bacterium]